MYISSVILLLFVKSIMCEQYYIQSANSNDNITCLTQQCLTLRAFSVRARHSHFSNVSLIFLPGNHSMEIDLHFSSTKIVLIHSEANSSWIVCEHPKVFIFINVTQVEMSNMRFLGCGGNNLAHIKRFSVENCTFLHSKVPNENISYIPGVIVAFSSNIVIRGSRFICTENKSVLNVLQSNITSSESLYEDNTAIILGLRDRSSALIDRCIFNNNSIMHNDFMLFGISDYSRLIILSSSLMNNAAMQAIFVVFNHSFMCISNSLLINSSLLTKETIFSTLITSAYSDIVMKEITISHTHSYALGNVLMGSQVTVMLHNCEIIHNVGNFTVVLGKSSIFANGVRMAQNHVVNGDMLLISDAINAKLSGIIISENQGSITIQKSMAIFSGGIIFTRNNGTLNIINSKVTFYSNGSINFFSKCGHLDVAKKRGAITSEQSRLYFYGNTYFLENFSKDQGGAIFATNSRIYMYGMTIFENNTATKSGGGILLDQSELQCFLNCTFNKNYAQTKGGAIHAIASKIIADVSFLKNNQRRYLLFTQNSGRLGGAINLEQNSKISLLDNGFHNEFKISFIKNTADYGGAIYIQEYSICGSQYFSRHSTQTECFLMAFVELNKMKVLINFSKNRAKISGPSIFGGLLDRCTVNPLYTENALDLLQTKTQFSSLSAFLYLKMLSNIHPSQISSEPVRLCYCVHNSVNCSSEIHSVSLQRGEPLHLSIAAVDQVNNTINATVHTVISSAKEFDSTKQSHNIPSSCTDLTIRLNFSPEPKEISLYAVGPCNGTGISQRKIQIKLSKCECPIGFSISRDSDSCDCVCDPSLSKFVKNCKFEIKSIVRETDMWIGYVNNTEYSGYLIYPNCPYDYCHPASPPLNINLNHANGSDTQCAAHRTGVLCSQCKPGFSFPLTGTTCVSCPKTWPGLLVANLMLQAFTGVFLVAIILAFNITVAAGTFNALVFYANVISANESNFLPFSRPNVLTIFVALLNLDSGIARCHIAGMDAYVATWVALMYPLYIISLVILVIIISRYSLRFSRIISKGNPVAALATLILLSYARILRTIIDALSFAILKYPNGSTKLVWLYDASVTYLRGKHIPLFLTAVLILIVGFTYTALLFSWQWLLRAPDTKALSWIRNTKLSSFMDAYLAPHMLKNRYWTGLLLFARVVLYLLTAVNMSGDPNFNLLIIGAVEACLILLQLYSQNKIYKNKFLDGFETTTHINLLLFTLASFYFIGSKINQKKVAYVSTTVAFVMFLTALFYHIFVRFIKTRCTRNALQFIKCKLGWKKFQYANRDLHINLIENKEYNAVAENVPTLTVVSIFPDHSSTTLVDEKDNKT